MKYSIILKISFSSIILFISAFAHGPALAQEAYKAAGAFISGGASGFLVDNYAVRQVKHKRGSAFISRPDPTAMEVLDTLRINGIRSLKDYTQWLPKNVKYKRDKGADIWSSPEETLERSYGDCEDYAFLNAAALRLLGYEPKVLGMGKPVRSHAICAFKENGHYLWFDNARLRKTNASTIAEFAGHIFKNHNYLCLLELNFDTGDWNILFKKSKAKPTFSDESATGNYEHE